MEFLLLGPLVVRSGEDVVPVQRGKQRTLLAALLLRANRLVGLDELAEALWDGDRPPSAQVTVQNYVKRLRQALGDADRNRISTQPRGYQIRAEPGELDLLRFRELLAGAQTAARNGSWDSAAARAADGLALWRGDALADVQSETLLRRDARRLTDLRLQAQEIRIDAELHLGRHAELIDELRQLTGLHPLRERFWALLMLALYRCGRQADALTAYQQARAALVEELGAEPGAELRSVHQQVLAGPAQSRRAAAAGPHQLPAPVPHFTGRAAELAALDQLLEEAGEPHRPVLISAIDGTPGVGKTALALSWAHHVAGRFPDGQLYVNLRGYDSERPVRAGDALAGFLRALGVPGQDIPADDDERAARYRSLLAGRRVLVVLDNASDVDQVRPLLPGSIGCVAVVTSRDALTGLVARDGARRLDLDLMPPAEAAGLLRALIGGRVDDDRVAAQALVDRCCRLPLALRVVAELAAARPDEPLADLADELAEQQRRLDLLEAGGDSRTAVRAVFSWSYQHLDAAAARAFRLLGLHPGQDYEPYAVAALTGGTLPQARALLDRLTRANLAQPTRHGRLVVHDLLRAYATELAARYESEHQRRAALTRLLDHYLRTASVAMDMLFPDQRHRRPRVLVAGTPVPSFTEPAAARAWLDAELPVIVSASAYAAGHGWPDHAIRLSGTLFWYLDVSGHYPEAVAIYGHALGAARQAGDRAAEATALYSLGTVSMRQGASQAAGDYLRQALDLYQAVGDTTQQALTLTCLGNVEARGGRYDRAARYLRQALAHDGVPGGNSTAVICLGIIDMRQGRHQQAMRLFRRAVALSREQGNPVGESGALDNLGFAELRQGDYASAHRHIERALALSRKAGYPIGEACALGSLGLLHVRERRYQEAASYLEQALALTSQTGERNASAEVLNHLGELMCQTGQADDAVDRYRAALALAAEIADPYEQARSHAGLARAYEALASAGQARRHWRKALQLYGEVGAPEADQIRQRVGGEDATAFQQDPAQPVPRFAGTV